MCELRICVTLKCNFQCIYCSKDGEGIYSELPDMDGDKIISAVRNLQQVGISSVRFTGGEPFARKDFLDIAKEIKKIDGIENTSVVSNGSLINEKIIDQIVEEEIFSSITISLDTLDSYEFKKITNSNSYNIVIHNICELSKRGINIRINYVLTKENIREFEFVLKFCIENRVNLKILDLYNDNKHFVSINCIEDILKRNEFTFIKTEELPGKLGTPMPQYTKEGIIVTLKDSNLGTTYSEFSCKKCKRYPCQLGIVGPIMTHDGKIKVCTLGRENGINCFGLDAIEEIKKSIESVHGVEKRWRPI